MKIENTQAHQPNVQALHKEAATQGQQKVQTPQQAQPQNPAHLGKSIDTKA